MLFKMQYVKLLLKTLRLLLHAPTLPMSLLLKQEALEQYEEVQAMTKNKQVKNQPLPVEHYVKLLVKTLRLLLHAPTLPMSLLLKQEALEQYEEVQAMTENKQVKNQPLPVEHYVKLLVKTLRLLLHAPTLPMSLLLKQEALEQYEEVQAMTENKQVKNQPLPVEHYVKLLANPLQFVG